MKQQTVSLVPDNGAACALAHIGALSSCAPVFPRDPFPLSFRACSTTSGTAWASGRKATWEGWDWRAVPSRPCRMPIPAWSGGPLVCCA